MDFLVITNIILDKTKINGPAYIINIINATRDKSINSNIIITPSTSIIIQIFIYFTSLKNYLL